METPRETLPSVPGDASIHTFIHRQPGKEAFLYATTWLNDHNWLLVVRQEETDAFRALRSAQMPILFIFLVGGSCIVIAAFALTNAIVRKMERTDAEKELLNQQLIGASRLAELGEMAAGFAHEINNPLQIISAELSLIRELQAEMAATDSTPDDASMEEMNDSIDQIKTQIGRCSRITAAILKFGRQGESKPAPVDLSAAVPEYVRMIRKKAEVHGIRLNRDLRMIRKKAEVHGIRLNRDLPDAPVTVLADSARLQQVLLNLLNNAMDAVIQRHGTEGGSISVRLAAETNGTARIEIADNGTGITPENIKKIFTPFFTTKPVGQGTGLGLSVCYGIIRQMGGKMEVSSTVDRGTEFSIMLPVIDGKRSLSS
jgi:two-component system NtrC family sensor kinase